MSPPDAAWSALAEEVLLGIRAWRAEHPRANWGEIEAAVEQRLAVLRGQILQDVALTSPVLPPTSAGRPSARPVRPAARRCGRRGRNGGA